MFNNYINLNISWELSPLLNIIFHSEIAKVSNDFQFLNILFVLLRIQKKVPLKTSTRYTKNW